jgi:hypothetical protein
MHGYQRQRVEQRTVDESGDSQAAAFVVATRGQVAQMIALSSHAGQVGK